jgi:amidophosphoribosyltransferase
MCGILGIYGRGDVIDEIYPGLISMQHRGQDAAGVITFDGKFHIKKGEGLVQNIFNSKNLNRLRGNIAIGHVRYPTVGGGGGDNAQPFYVNSPYGLAMAHNGNLTNYLELKEELMRKRLRHLNSDCDVEVLLNLCADELLRIGSDSSSPDAIFETVKRIYDTVEGAYSVIALVGGEALLAFRDPHGIKPLVFGRKGDAIAFASESVALDVLGYTIVRDVKPGEVMYVDSNRTVHSAILREEEHRPCIFEWVYFARPDSVIDGISVYEARLRLGDELGRLLVTCGVKPDVVIPVPDTSRAAALSVASFMGVPYREGLIKNRYIGRTFIMPTQFERQLSIKFKLNPIRPEIEGRKVLLVDDSIVRGNTSRKMVSLVQSAGAREVYFGSYSPPLKYPCVYGIDMQTRGEFIARGRSNEEIRTEIGCDKLIYQTVEGLIRGVRPTGMEREFCTACFSGTYPTAVPRRCFEEIEKHRINTQKTTVYRE